jgi:hypothetical protein
MRLSAANPPIDEILLSSLADIGITMSEDLVLPHEDVPLNMHLRSIFTRLPAGTIEFAALLKLSESLMVAISSNCISAMDLLRQSQASHTAFPRDEFTIGVQGLDNIAGSFAGGRVLELSGPPSTGKTVSYVHALITCTQIHPQVRVDSGVLGTCSVRCCPASRSTRKYVCTLGGYNKRFTFCTKTECCGSSSRTCFDRDNINYRCARSPTDSEGVRRQSCVCDTGCAYSCASSSKSCV